MELALPLLAAVLVPDGKLATVIVPFEARLEMGARNVMALVTVDFSDCDEAMLTPEARLTEEEVVLASVSTLAEFESCPQSCHLLAQLATVAREVKERSRRQCATNQTKAGIRSRRGRVLHRVPPNIGAAKQRAANLVPVIFGIGDASDGLAHGFAAKREARFRNPHRLALGCSLGGAQSVIKKGLAMADVVLLRFLEIRVAIEAEKVRSIHHHLVGAVDPGGPGIDVAYRDTIESCVGNNVTDLLDIMGNRERCRSGVLLVFNAGRRDAIQILAAHRNASH